MAIPAIPVWSIRPNWRDGIRERLSWLTDIMDSTNGTEQRMALRLSPRRSFEITFNPTDEARSYFDLFLHRLSAEEFFLPLFHDKAKLAAAVAVDDTELLFDNTYREFETGGFAILLGDGPFDFEVVEIEAQDDNGLTISALTKAWTKNATVHPLRIVALSDESQISALTSRVGAGTVLFTCVRANDYDEGVWPAPSYNDRAIISIEPNRREALDLSFIRKSVTVDNDLGIPYLADEANRAFTVQLHSWMIVGRQAHAEFRSMLYRLRGSSQAVWLPSFNRDFKLARAADAADDTLDITKIGYEYTGGAITGRNHVYFREEEIASKIIDVGVPLAITEERLELEAAIGADLPAGRWGSFLEAVRFDQDEIEIHHYTDSNGTSECSASFRSYQDERVEDEAVGEPGYGGEMAGAHRFWRMMIEENNGGARVGVIEIELRASKNGDDQTGAGLGTSFSGGNGVDGINEDHPRAFDNNEATGWGRGVTGDCYVGWDYGVGIRKILLELWFKGANDYTHSPAVGTIDYSEDGEEWTPFYAFDLKCLVAQAERKIPEPATPGKHRAWRIFIPANSGDPDFTFVGEIEMRGTPGGPDLTSALVDSVNDPLGRAIASQPFNINATPDRAFANNGHTTAWLSTQVVNQWVGYVFPDPVDIQEVTVQGAFEIDMCPSSIILEWSDDEENWTAVAEMDTTWDDLDTINILTVGA